MEMQEQVSIYKGSNDVEAAFRRLERDEAISAENKKLIVKFSNTWLAKGFTKGRVAKVIFCLRRLATWLDKPFETATKDDLIALVGKLEQEKYADHTKYDIKVVLKTFYKWLKGDDEQYPKEVSWLHPRMKTRHKLPDELLTEEEVERIANAANHPRDKALILTLYESGCRIGELLTLKVKNVQFDHYGAVLKVYGKTGHRRVRIITSAQALATWLQFYQGKNNPEAYLWPSSANNSHETNRPVLHRSIMDVVTKLTAKAGVTKHVYPHLFRHSRATYLANKLTEAQMKEHFGWQQSSDMASVYVHLSGRDVDKTLLSLQGIAQQPEQTSSTETTFCQKCGQKNQQTSKFCTNCGITLENPLLLQHY